MAGGISAGALIALALVAFIVFILFAVFFPALLLAFIFVLAGLLVMVLYRAGPYGIWVGLSLLVIGAIFGFFQVGQQASLTLIHAL